MRSNYDQLIKDARFYSKWKEDRFVESMVRDRSFQRDGDFVDYLYWVGTVSRGLDNVRWNINEVDLHDYVDNIVLNSKGLTNFWLAWKAAKLVLKSIPMI
jgi:hypothetical protein